MKTVVKLFFYLFVSSTMLVFGYEAVKFARDQVRITNAETLSRVILYYHLTEHRLPPSGRNENVSQFLFDRKLTDKIVRDPVFTSATVIMDEYAFALLKVYNKLMNSDHLEGYQQIIDQVKERVDGAFDEDHDVNQQFAKLRALAADGEIQENLADLKEVVNLSDRDLIELRKLLNDSDLRSNMDRLSELASEPVPPECVIAYQADKRNEYYEISVHLESRFLKHRMKEDGGNDDARWEVGTELELNTAVKSYGSSVRPASRKTTIIK